TGIDSAIAGGFTAVVNMPNTSPVIDSVPILEYVNEKAETYGKASVYTASTLTINNEGKSIVDINSLHTNGIVAFLDDAGAIKDPDLLHQAFGKVTELGIPIASNDKRNYFELKGSVNRGKISNYIK